ncbi:YidC/Oxa1 family membrane protein insertase [Anaerosolibacter carboniphilus]|uniref:YidC/Oxa1 family membrane protein insertase n=1 Tax=Anaerosolibacter carboniphilus TaxID=1417629 RepID=A0A841KXH5_9FIRM|nr:YidC/Oxa1 family membrane protein insertase [Anaerosolibacter carboniphilus]MBB6218057.1 YidC/Oxa1 family membrane protein insertase [Anaerosolibacter carboniphilus]
MIAKPLGMLLNFLYGLIGNYGITIIAFTVIVKLILLPLTLQQLKSTKQMSELQPKLKELQEKYKNDKEKLNAKTVELYQQYKINPLGGCLPLLIQMPIIFGLFAVLREPIKYISDPNFVQAVNEAFLWIPNLSKPDPIILPVLAGITTYFSMNSASTGAAQNQTMKTMNMVFPVMILWWGRSFPAGLTLYWVVSNIFQMVQQYLLPKAGTVGTPKEESN